MTVMLEISSHQTFAQPTYSDPWQDIGLQNDILQLAGVKDLRRGRAKLVKAFCSWDDLLEADFASRNFGNIITKAREFYGALKKLETDRRKNAEGGEDCLYFLDDFIARETGKKGVLLLGVPDVLRSTSAVIKAFKTLKGRLGLPHERGQRRSQYYFACELVAELELAVIPLGGHFSLDATSQTGTIITAIDRLREADPDCDRNCRLATNIPCIPTNATCATRDRFVRGERLNGGKECPCIFATGAKIPPAFLLLQSPRHSAHCLIPRAKGMNARASEFQDFPGPGGPTDPSILLLLGAWRPGSGRPLMTNQCDSASSKPLWQRFYGMSESEAAAEIAEDRRRMQSGEITELKAQERADAWKRSAEQQLREADALRRYRALRTGTVLDAD